jgi:hypothetical protein
VKKAAEQVRDQIMARAALMLKLTTTDGLTLRDRTSPRRMAAA